MFSPTRTVTFKLKIILAGSESRVIIIDSDQDHPIAGTLPAASRGLGSGSVLHSLALKLRGRDSARNLS